MAKVCYFQVSVQVINCKWSEYSTGKRGYSGLRFRGADFKYTLWSGGTGGNCDYIMIFQGDIKFTEGGVIEFQRDTNIKWSVVGLQGDKWSGGCTEKRDRLVMELQGDINI